MKKTDKYQLNQWEKSDRIQMEDFNADNMKMEQALGALVTQLTAEANARSEAVTAESNARKAADTALENTLSGKGNCRIAYGTYTGKGTYGEGNANKLTFDFEPKIVIIQHANGATGESTSSSASDYIMLTLVKPQKEFYKMNGNATVYITWTGNSVSWVSYNTAAMQMNLSNTTYLYLALG